jgi:hypothetical protein
MTRIKSTTVLRQPKDNAESEVVETSTCIDAADASSTFDQDAMRDVLVRGHEDRENSETDGEENGDMDNSKTFEGTIVIRRRRLGGRLVLPLPLALFLCLVR